MDCREKSNAQAHLDDARRYWRRFAGGAAFAHHIDSAERLAVLALRLMLENPWRDLPD
jgi:hypothetical protein